jgi:hypothetical protein
LPDEAQVAPRRLGASATPFVGAYSQILRAPIFSPDRAGGGGGMPGAPAGIETYALVGVASGPGFATGFIKGSDGRTIAVRPGQSVAGWRLAGVNRAQLTFVREGELRTLTIGAAPAASAPPAPTGAQAAAGLPQVADEDEE